MLVHTGNGKGEPKVYEVSTNRKLFNQNDNNLNDWLGNSKMYIRPVKEKDRIALFILTHIHICIYTGSTHNLAQLILYYNMHLQKWNTFQHYLLTFWLSLKFF